MAAAEYYNASAAAQSTPPFSPYHQSPQQRPHKLNGSPIPQYNLPHRPFPQLPPQRYLPPPPYAPLQQEEHRPSVHFASSSPPSRRSSERPSFSNPSPSHHGQYSVAQPHHSPYAHHGSPDLAPNMAVQPPHLRSYMHDNYSDYQLSSGYASDPESRRRRHHHHHRHNDIEDNRDTPRARPRKHRSRSNNTDGFIGAASGGLIGDLIFPGLGTVGGAVAGWFGGKDYGKHRQEKKERLHREQKEWEHKFRSRSYSGDYGQGHGHDRHGSYPR